MSDMEEIESSKDGVFKSDPKPIKKYQTNGGTLTLVSQMELS